MNIRQHTKLTYYVLKAAKKLSDIGYLLPTPTIKIASSDDIGENMAYTVVSHNTLIKKAIQQMQGKTADQLKTIVKDLANMLEYTTTIYFNPLVAQSTDTSMLMHVIMHELTHTISEVVAEDARMIIDKESDPTEGHHHIWKKVVDDINKKLHLNPPIAQMAHKAHIDSVEASSAAISVVYCSNPECELHESHYPENRLQTHFSPLAYTGKDILIIDGETCYDCNIGTLHRTPRTDGYASIILCYDEVIDVTVLTNYEMLDFIREFTTVKASRIKAEVSRYATNFKQKEPNVNFAIIEAETGNTHIFKIET